MIYNYQNSICVLGGIAQNPINVNNYQNSICVLGGIAQNPINVNNYQNFVYVLGTDYIPPFNENYNGSGNLSLSGQSLTNSFTLFNYNGSGNLSLSGQSLTNSFTSFNYNGSGNLSLSGLSIVILTTEQQNNYVVTSNGNLSIYGSSLVLNQTSEIDYIFISGQNNGYFLTDFRIIFNTNQEVPFTLNSTDRKAKFKNIINIKSNDENIKLYEFKYVPFYEGESKISISSSLPIKGEPIVFNYKSENEKNGINPKIKFKVNFEKNNVNKNIANTQTMQLKGYSGTLKNNDEFFLYGQDALFAKNNLKILCLEIIEE